MLSTDAIAPPSPDVLISGLGTSHPRLHSPRVRIHYVQVQLVRECSDEASSMVLLRLSRMGQALRQRICRHVFGSARDELEHFLFDQLAHEIFAHVNVPRALSVHGIFRHSNTCLIVLVQPRAVSLCSAKTLEDFAQIDHLLPALTCRNEFALCR